MLLYSTLLPDGFRINVQTAAVLQTMPRRQSAEGREDAQRKPLGSPSRATSTPTRTGLTENRYVASFVISNMSCEQLDYVTMLGP